MKVGEPRWPDLFIVGAARSGTTALYGYLRNIPQFASSTQKSPNYFAADIPQPEWETRPALAMARHWISDERTYRDQFRVTSETRVVVDVSPVYLQSTLVAKRIHEVNPQAKIVAILRDPADRAFGHFLGRRRDGIEGTNDFGTWLDHMPPFTSAHETAFGHYVACGRYHHLLTSYFESFAPSQILVLFYEDFVADPLRSLQQILSFAGLDTDLVDRTILSDERPNRSGEIANPVMRRLWVSTISLRTQLRPFLPNRLRNMVGHRVLSDLDQIILQPAWRTRIIDYLAEDIERLALLTQRDLSRWLS